MKLCDADLHDSIHIFPGMASAPRRLDVGYSKALVIAGPSDSLLVSHLCNADAKGLEVRKYLLVSHVNLLQRRP